MRTATGKMAGPENPPMVFAMTGFLVFRSIRSPKRVLIRLMPSAPAASHALAMETMSVTLGESLIMIGFLVTFLTAAVTSAAEALRAAEDPEEVLADIAAHPFLTAEVTENEGLTLYRLRWLEEGAEVWSLELALAGEVTP